MPPSPEPPYPLDDTTTSTLTLSSGHTLCYAEYGDPNGTPIFFLHGFPASRIEAAGLDHVASRVHARLIALDRPGMGGSTRNPTRTVLSHVSEVEALAAHLSLTRYGVIGISGGGPYALACAYALPHTHLRAVAIVCGLGSPDMGYWGMKWPNYIGWTIGQRWFPGLCRWWFSREASARLDLSDEQRLRLIQRDFESSKGSMHVKDREVFGEENWMRMHLVRGKQVYAQGMNGMSDDFRVLNSDFGFRIEDIRRDLCIRLWYARWDENVPLQHGVKIWKRLGGDKGNENVRLEVRDETHASVWANLKEEYLGNLVKDVLRD